MKEMLLMVICILRKERVFDFRSYWANLVEAHSKKAKTSAKWKQNQILLWSFFGSPRKESEGTWNQEDRIRGIILEKKCWEGKAWDTMAKRKFLVCYWLENLEEEECLRLNIKLFDVLLK